LQANPTVPEFLARLDPERPDFSVLQPGPNGMQRIAVGPDGANTGYTEAVMKAWKSRSPFFWNVEGLSLHSYTFGRGFPMSASSTDFGNAEYAAMLRETMGMERLITAHSEIMDRYDPDRKVALVVDEWGAWLKPVAGSNPTFLRQQNSMRDAILAALNLNIFARHADRVRMANIAQMVNVIQSMILTEGSSMLLTPTYHVYRLYAPFQNATLVPVTFDQGEYREGELKLPRVDAIAARDAQGKLWLAVTNLDTRRAFTTAVDINDIHADSAVGDVLTASRVNAVNTFDHPDNVAPRPIRADIRDGRVVLSLPPNSVAVLQVR
jgi:alpha-L-arabinofuranosidase